MPGKVVFGLGGFGETDVAVTGTCNIGAAPTRRVRFTAGTGPVTSFGAGTNRRRKCRSAVVFTLTHGASLSLPTSANISVEVGDTWDADSDASGDWIVSNYQRNSGMPIMSARAFSAGLGIWYPLAISTAALTVSAVTTQETLATVVIPAGAMGPNGAIRWTALWETTNGADDKIPRVALGATVFSAPVILTNVSYLETRIIKNVNSASVQVAGPVATSITLGVSPVAIATGAIDTSVSQNLVFSGQKETAGNLLSLRYYIVDILYAA